MQGCSVQDPQINIEVRDLNSFLEIIMPCASWIFLPYPFINYCIHQWLGRIFKIGDQFHFFSKISNVWHLLTNHINFFFVKGSFLVRRDEWLMPHNSCFSNHCILLEIATNQSVRLCSKLFVSQFIAIVFVLFLHAVNDLYSFLNVYEVVS